MFSICQAKQLLRVFRWEQAESAMLLAPAFQTTVTRQMETSKGSIYLFLPGRKRQVCPLRTARSRDEVNRSTRQYCQVIGVNGVTPERVVPGVGKE
jgi:hypothetical protein